MSEPKIVVPAAILADWVATGNNEYWHPVMGEILQQIEADQSDGAFSPSWSWHYVRRIFERKELPEIAKDRLTTIFKYQQNIAEKRDRDAGMRALAVQPLEAAKKYDAYKFAQRLMPLLHKSVDRVSVAALTGTYISFGSEILCKDGHVQIQTIDGIIPAHLGFSSKKFCPIRVVHIFGDRMVMTGYHKKSAGVISIARAVVKLDSYGIPDPKQILSIVDIDGKSINVVTSQKSWGFEAQPLVSLKRR
jgi:hypothetical protein